MPFTLTAHLAFAAPFTPSADIEFSPIAAPDPRQLTVAVTLSGLQPTLPLHYDNNVWRGLIADPSAAMQRRPGRPGLFLWAGKTISDDR